MRVRRSLLVSFVFVPGLTALVAQAPRLPPLPQIDTRELPAETQKSVQEAYDAVVRDPDDATLNGKLGMVLQANDPGDRGAEASYHRAHQLAPSVFRWGYYWGLVLAREGKYEEAAAALSEAVHIDSGYAPAQLNLGECLLAAGKWQQAGELFEALVRDHPEDPHAYYGLARVKAVRNDLKGSVESFRKACDLFPNFGAAHYGLSRVYERLGSKESSAEELKLYDSTRGSAPPLADPLLAEVMTLNVPGGDELREPAELADQGRIPEAIAAYEKALLTHPGLEKAHVRLIALYGRLGQIAKAEEHFQAAMRLDPNDPECYFNHGLLLASQEKYPEAEQAFHKALEINPRFPGGHTNLGYMLEAQGKLTEAVAEYEKTLADAPQDAPAHFALGRIAVNQDQYQVGIEHFQQCLRTGGEGDRPAYLYALGAAYARAGDRKNGVEYLRRARDEARAHGQSDLLGAIEEDLKRLEQEPGPP